MLICPKNPCLCGESKRCLIPAVGFWFFEDMPELLCWLAVVDAKPEYWGFHRFTANW